MDFSDLVKKITFAGSAAGESGSDGRAEFPVSGGERFYRFDDGDPDRSPPGPLSSGRPRSSPGTRAPGLSGDLRDWGDRRGPQIGDFGILRVAGVPQPDQAARGIRERDGVYIA